MDVAPLLRAKLQSGDITMPVNNEEFGSDPARGVQKRLEMTYSYRGNTYSKIVEEKDLLLLPQP
jgi:hypothetical protein